MGVQFDRVLDALNGPFETVKGFASNPGSVASVTPTGMYMWSGAQNDAFTAANRLLKAGITVERDAKGDFYTPTTAAARDILSRFAAEKGINVGVAGGSAIPAGLVKLRPVRIALWDVYGGSMTSGWTRFVFDQFEFPYEVVYAPQLDAGDLRSKYDVIFFPNGAVVGSPMERARGGTGRAETNPPEDLPAEYRSHVGRMTVEKTLPALRTFLEKGGVILASGSATSLARQLGLPIADAPTDSTGARLPRDRYYIPGSVLSVRVDTSEAIAKGMPARADVIFDNSPAFRLLSGAKAAGIDRVAWFDSPTPLRSGWAWGQRYLDGAAAIVKAPVGEGTLYLYGPEMNFRSQSQGTFKFLFNAFYPPAAK
jgi:hypothetical protein